MKKLDNQHDDLAGIREQIIGLGEKSIRKSYYPELQQKIADLERFKTLLDQSNDAIILADANTGTILYVSRSACTQIGYTEAEYYTMTIYDIAPENARELDMIFTGKSGSIIFEARLKKKNAEEIPYELNMRRVTFKNKDYIFTIARDITERKRSEDYLTRLSLLKLQLLGPYSLEKKLKIITDSVVSIFGADFARIWMILEGDLCKRGCIYATLTRGPGVSCDRTRCLHLMASSGRYTSIEGSHRRVPMGFYKIGRIATGEEQYFVTNDVTHDPRVHDHEWARSLGLVSFAGFRLLSPEGQPIGVLAFFSKKPITSGELKYLEDMANTTSYVIQWGLTEEALRESERRFRQLAESSPMPIALYDENENIKYLNTKFIRTFGYTLEDIPSLNAWWLLAYPDPTYRQEIIEKWTGYVDKAARGLKEITPMEADVTCKNLSVRRVEFYGTVIGDQKLVILQDITERKRAEEEVLEAKAEAELYLDLMSHDLTNMNQALMGYLEMIALTLESGKIDRGLIDDSMQIINRSTKMINDVKKLTLLRTGKVPLKDVDVCEILSKVKSRYSHAPGRPVTINYTPRRDCIVKAGDMLRDVFDNLVDNAIRHSTGPVTIDLAVEKVEIEGRIYYKNSVTDTGPGIPDRMKKMILMTMKERKDKVERRGFGLCLVRTLVDYYHGHVWVEDRVPGDHTKGAMFVVLLPAAR